MMESVEHVDESETIRETLGGSPRAFGAIVRRYQADVRMAVSRWIHCPATADDLAQEVFVAAYENLNRFDLSGSLRSWLMGIARNKVKLHLRTAARRRKHEQNLLHLQIQQWKAQELEKGSSLEAGELGSLAACIEKLPPESGQLIKAHYFDGKTLESIARESDRSGGSLRMVLLRIRKVLAKCIQGQQQ